MKKYVVKNCPCFVKDDSFENTCATLYTCESDENCLLKQIIEKCKYEMQESEKWKIHGYILAKDILKFFDIQEVN